MKKLIALLMSFIMSLSTSTKFNPTDDKVYTKDTYTVQETTLPDYRQYFGNAKASATSGCNTHNFYSRGVRVQGDNVYGYWLVDGDNYSIDSPDKNKVTTYTYDSDGKKQTNTGQFTSKTDNSGNKYIHTPKGMFPKGSAIIMPYDGTLSSTSANGSSITAMTVLCTHPNGTQYRIQINNMKMWYCDKDRTGEFDFHTGEEQFGKKFSAGNVLGYATEDTYVVIKPIRNKKVLSDYSLTLNKFYKGKTE